MKKKKKQIKKPRKQKNKNKAGSLRQAIRGKWPTDDILQLIDDEPLAAQVRQANGRYPLHLACKKSKDDVIMKLLEVFPQAAQFPDEKGWYPLHIACYYRQSKDVILKLIEIHPDAVAKKVYVDDFWMRNPLRLLASVNDYANVVKYLLQFPDLDVNATNHEGNSALHIAINWGSFDIVDALLRHPFIIIDQRNHDNETPFDLVDKKITTIKNIYVHREDEDYLKLIFNAFFYRNYDEYDDNDEDSRYHVFKEKHRLTKYRKVKRQLEDHFLMNRWGSYEYFYRNVVDWSMNQ